MSIAFATLREAVIVDLQQQLVTQSVPQFNAEIEDVRRVYDDERANPKIGESLAFHNRRARYEDMRVKREMFIKTLHTSLHSRLLQRVEEYGGDIEDSIDRDNKPVKVVKFPDGSSARLPRGLWVQYDQYHRP